MTMTADVSVHDSVRQLEPLIRRHAATAEGNRTMAPEVMAALVDAGLLRMWVPKAYGGMELEPNTALDVMEDLARIDSATGWVVSNCVFITILYQFLPAPVVDELLGRRDAVTCGSFVPPGTAREDGDQYVVNGEWSFASAAEHASSLVALSVSGAHRMSRLMLTECRAD
jgi:alkylation response protein AidB-like acyl-CoA dehydrogenase